MVLALTPGISAYSTPRTTTASQAKPFVIDQGHLLEYRIRRCQENDLDGLFELAGLSGPGFTSLPADRSVLAARLSGACRAQTDDHLLMLEHKPTAKIVGCAAIKARSGLSGAHWNFRLVGAGEDGLSLTEQTTLVPTRAFAGQSELGSLFLHPDHRLPGVGRYLSLARLMMIAAFPHKFSSVLWSELRGVVRAQDDCPFYDAVMGPLLNLPFKEADRLFALGGDAGLTDYLPKAPVRVGDLPDHVRQILAQTHEAGRGARRLLEGAGFVFAGVVDLFDGGPLVGSMKEDLPMIAKATRRIDPAEPRSLVADFDRCGQFECRVHLGTPNAENANVFGVTANRLVSAL